VVDFRNALYERVLLRRSRKSERCAGRETGRLVVMIGRGKLARQWVEACAQCRSVSLGGGLVQIQIAIKLR
jgi:hypothetical protein